MLTRRFILYFATNFMVINISVITVVLMYLVAVATTVIIRFVKSFNTARIYTTEQKMSKDKRT